MTHVPHELFDEFPDRLSTLHRLRVEDAHFARLADAYHQVNREIHRIETDIAPVSDVRQGDLRKRRMHLKDEIAAILQAADNIADGVVTF